MIDWLPNYNQSNIVIALRAALAAAAILYVLEIYDIKNGMGHLGFLAVVLSCFAKPRTTSRRWRGRPKFDSTQAFATATVVGAIEGVCRDMLKSADVVPNLLLLFPPAPAATIPARKGE